MVNKSKSLTRKLGLTLASALAVSPLVSPTNAPGEVKYSIEIQNSIPYPQRVFSRDAGIDCTVKVMVDNTTEQNATGGLEWTLIAPPELQFFGVDGPVNMNGINYGDYTYIWGFDEQQIFTNDFFYPYYMSHTNTLFDSTSQGPAAQPASKKVVTPQNPNVFTGRRYVVGDGPKQTKGIVGTYIFTSSPSSYTNNSVPLTFESFKVTDTKAYDVNGNPQPSSGRTASVALVKDWKTSVSMPPVIIQDINGLDVDIFVSTQQQSAPNGIQRNRPILEYSTDLRNWSPLMKDPTYLVSDDLLPWPQNFQTVTNNTILPQDTSRFLQWYPFSYTDTNALATDSKRFYRVRSPSE